MRLARSLDQPELWTRAGRGGLGWRGVGRGQVALPRRPPTHLRFERRGKLFRERLLEDIGLVVGRHQKDRGPRQDADGTHALEREACPHALVVDLERLEVEVSAQVQAKREL